MEQLQIHYVDLGVPRVTDLKADMSIGRTEGNDLVLNHPSVSRRHAELERTPDGRWLVRDLRSRNGTRVNGEVVNEQALRPGDLVQIGQFTLRLFAEETPSRMSRTPATDDTPTYSTYPRRSPTIGRPSDSVCSTAVP